MILLTLLYLIIFYIIIDFIKKNYKTKNQLPSPLGIALPIIGHLHLLRTDPYKTLAKASKKTEHGILKCWNGEHLMVVVDNPSIIKQMYVNTNNFTDRPQTKVFEIISRNYKNSGFANGEKWKHLRGLYAPSFTKIKSRPHENIILKYVNFEIKSLKNHAITNSIYNPFLIENINSFGTKVITEIIFGREFSENEVYSLIGPMNKLFGILDTPFPSESISFLKPFYRRSYKECDKQCEELFKLVEKVYDDHLLNLDKDNPKDVMDVMIVETDFKEKDHVICICCDLLMGTKDTFNTIVLWFFVLMINYQDVQLKGYQEIIKVLECTGRDHVTIEDIDKLPYIDGIIKEISRIHPAGPLSVPRTAINDIMINGYFIPKGCHVFQNTYGAVYNYMKESDEPCKMKPERWIENEKLRKDGKLDPTNDLALISLPFSSGIRNCPGVGFAEYELFLLFSNIILNFHLSSPNNLKLNESGHFGLTMKPFPFLVDLKLR
ncbi:cytochrome P450 family protein [Dictyostelium discoideum AX4]|uniref:Cytochrome P450 monooxygenase 521A1 n=2 Tax=Dictyostelium discoideum TaxID=44689 RepID=C521A_DICDI|nr:cytochrome P450 family protein [Dictyostelium discoideum AX4]Q1ZXA1.1 RecName: Full=Cytochrome P450 monooxygenase 521A1; AltName: Full=Discodiene biosynthesis cluster protein cyp521A1 [Dictyostelium discoideum]EAS66806.1 cytochrome P450 family protein [Dictyostelium discoideum AX4]QCG86237.1 cytochrome P450 family protein [Dictyostelium discoideum]|eukprot:XP_001134489.1 cytochrome P450 family protein [Dictyostelium discoideum AX4]